MPASSVIVGGNEARIQRLPSSRVGRNSPPSSEPTNPQATRNITPSTTVILRLFRDQWSTGKYSDRNVLTTKVSTSLTCAGSNRDDRHGVTVKVAINAPTSAYP